MKKKIYQLSLLLLSILVFSCTQPPKQTETAQTKEAEIPSEPVEFKDFGSEPFVFNVEEYTLQNETYRTSIWTGTHMQMTVMTLQPGEDIGLELHTDIEQFIRVEEGEGVIKMGDSENNLSFERTLSDDFGVFIPAGKWHNLINTSSDKTLKLYSIYSPVEHPHSTVHKNREEGAEAHVH